MVQFCISLENRLMQFYILARVHIYHQASLTPSMAPRRLSAGRVEWCSQCSNESTGAASVRLLAVMNVRRSVYVSKEAKRYGVMHYCIV